MPIIYCDRGRITADAVTDGGRCVAGRVREFGSGRFGTCEKQRKFICEYRGEGISVSRKKERREWKETD